MNPQEQNESIARSLGWKEGFPKGEAPHPETQRGGILLPYNWVNERTHERLIALPNYCGSLDAMAIAEEVFHSSHQVAGKYARKLEDIVYRTKHSGTDIEFQLLNASPSQRAEAYLKTLNLWK